MSNTTEREDPRPNTPILDTFEGMTDEQKKWLDEASLDQLLHKWRFAPVGDPMLQGGAGKYYEKVIAIRRSEAGPEEWTAASKRVGWDKPS